VSAWSELLSYLPAAIHRRLRRAYSRHRATMSQIGQDLWVYGEVFNEKRGGYFVDVGAFNGVVLSNTFLLEARYGWRGLCIEPNPASFSRLVRERSATCLQVCLDRVEGEVLYVDRGLASGIVDENMDNKPGSVVAGEIPARVSTRTLASVLREANAPNTIDYLSIDCEGGEERILGSFPFGEYVFCCITVERPSANLREVLAGAGYLLVKEVPGLDAFYVHRFFRENYVENALKFWARYA